MERSDSTTLDEIWKFPNDLLEPQFYPDPGLFRSSLEQLTKDDEMLRNMANSKATIRVLAPYLKTMRKEKKIMENAMKKTGKKPIKEKVVFEKKTKEQLLSKAPDLSEKDELLLSIHETADDMKVFVDAKRVILYLVNPERQELCQSPHPLQPPSANISCKIELRTTMAAHTAYTKHYVVSDNVATDERFPQGLGTSDDTPFKYALCVPIKTTDDKVVAVLEFVRDASQAGFSVKDIQTVLLLTIWMGATIMQNALYTAIVQKQELTDYLIQLTNHYHSEKADTDKYLTDLVVFAREVVLAEKCTLYLVDKKYKERVVLEQYDQGLEDSRHLYKLETKVHVFNDGSLLSKVVFNQEVVDYQNSSTSDTNNENEEHSVRSVLCAPIILLRETIGVIELMNKKGEPLFNQEDKETLETFASFSATGIKYVKAREQLKKEKLKKKVLKEMLFHHIKPCSHDQEALKDLSLELPDNFFTLSWYPSPDEMPRLLEYTINMFHEVLGDSFMVLNDFPKFVVTVKNCYRSNPYHSFLHAFGVSHAMANIISRYHNVFTGVERKSLMIAALCHDVDHRGYNNNFVQLTRHYLAELYETSPLENHHYAVTKIILEQCGMFKYIKTEIYNDFLEEIYNAIIATDLSLYFQCRMELLQIADEKNFTFKNSAHRRLVKSLMMTACDLSGQTKPLPICQKITEDVYEEFYQQGDVEKRMGYVPLPTMDRSKKSMVAENQVQFLSVVVLPCVETVSRIFTALSPMVADCKLLLKQWKEMAEFKELEKMKTKESASAL